MTIAERINAERIVLAGWGRAILLQLAHPLVAQGVADHSTFRGTLLTAAMRLHHTVAAMRKLTFGTTSEVRAALDGILAIHRRVNGVLPVAVGSYPAGARYSAEDASLVLWVHATLMDSLPLVYESVVAPITDAQRDEWCRQSAPVARALGAGADVPETWAAMRTYFERMLASEAIVVGDTARALAADVLAPPQSVLIAPARALNRIVTVGLLPAGIRAQYGFEWDSRDDTRLRQALRLLRLTRRALPKVVAHWPDARR